MSGVRPCGSSPLGRPRTLAWLAPPGRHRYLVGHLDQLHYDTALEAGWPIANGAVEGTCRHRIVI
ncbi:hypothetical protein FNH04_12985 [Streptomyces phyllanthi]|uniref:Uncharacterized protein n=1 Tax=Streptomyces phyllanthi TaxID=1803180 RepID=A0A5N8W3A9_9ACTN|nr:hypothetical protein [Streptomyces phyllanthi]